MSVHRLALIAVAAAAAVPAAAQTVAPQPAQVSIVPSAAMPIVTLDVDQDVRAKPDLALIGAGVQTQAPSAQAAMSQNAAQMEKVVAQVKKAGIAANDIQTSGVQLSPQYQYPTGQNGDNGPPRLVGYQASNEVRVRVHKLDGLGKVLDALVAAGANNLNGPTFSVEDSDAVLDEARVAALKKAQARADLYAKAAGFSHARLLSVSEGGGSPPPPVPMAYARSMAMKDSAASTPVEAGMVDLNVSLTVQYALER